GLKKHGTRKWRREVADVVTRLRAALEPDDVVIGGGNAKHLKELPPGSRLGDNANAFLGGFRLWKDVGDIKRKERQRGSVHRTIHRTTPRSQARRVEGPR